MTKGLKANYEISSTAFYMFYNTAYWLLAMQYWTISLQLEGNVKYPKALTVFYYAGIVLNMVLPIFQGYYFAVIYAYDLAVFFLAFLSFCFLTDALRRLNRVCLVTKHLVVN